MSEYDSKSFQDLTKSPKSDSGTKKTDRRARYWKFLFDNLQRAVDAIYDTCETDESVVECKVLLKRYVFLSQFKLNLTSEALTSKLLTLHKTDSGPINLII